MSHIFCLFGLFVYFCASFSAYAHENPTSVHSKKSPYVRYASLKIIVEESKWKGLKKLWIQTRVHSGRTSKQDLKTFLEQNAQKIEHLEIRDENLGLSIYDLLINSGVSQNLSSLYIYHNYISSKCSKPQYNEGNQFPRLQKLHIEGGGPMFSCDNYINDKYTGPNVEHEQISTYFRFSPLKELKLSGGYVYPHHLKNISQLPFAAGLVILHLQNLKFGNRIVDPHNIVPPFYLKMRNRKIKQDKIIPDLSWIIQFQALKKLTLKYCNLDEAIFQTFPWDSKELPKLDFLDLTCNHTSVSKYKKKLQNHFPKAKILMPHSESSKLLKRASKH